MSVSVTWPRSPADSTTRVPQPQQPLERGVRERHVVDPGERDVATAAGDDALAQDQPVVGQDVDGGQPAQERQHGQPDQGDQRDHEDDQARAVWLEPLGIRAAAYDADRHDDQQRDDRPDQRLPVRVQLDVDLLTVGQQPAGVCHAQIMPCRHVGDVTRGQRVRRGLRVVRTSSRPASSTPVGLARRRLAGRDGDPDRPGRSSSRSRGTPRRCRWRAGRRRPTASGRTGARAPAGRPAAAPRGRWSRSPRGQRGRRRHRQLVGGQADVQARAHDHGRPGRRC